MLSSPRTAESSDLLTPIAEFDKWQIQEMYLTHQKVAWLWEEMNKYRTLIGTLVKGDADNFIALLSRPDSLWFEVVDKKEGKIVGILYITEMYKIIDCEVHMMFFDRKPHEKHWLCRHAIEWAFERFPFRRITASIPAMYFATIRLAKKVGFKEEGRKRDAVLIGNKWVDIIVLGILRQEVV